MIPLQNPRSLEHPQTPQPHIVHLDLVLVATLQTLHHPLEIICINLFNHNCWPELALGQPRIRIRACRVSCAVCLS